MTARAHVRLKRITLLISVIFFSLTLLILNSKYAVSAAASISLTPSSGLAGTTVTVTGSGFGAPETGIYVLFDSTTIVSGISTTSGNWSTYFNIPASASGSHAIYAVGPITGTVGPMYFTTTPAISLNKNSGSPGSSITVSGVSFGSNETNIVITFDGNQVASSISAGQTGAWSGNFIVPPSAAGWHSVGASGSTTSASSVPSVSFNVGAAVTLNKSSGSPGSTITVSGAGFTTNETGISVTFDGNTVASNISANTSGSWTTTFNVPSSTSGSHTIGVSGSITLAASVPSVSFNVGAGLALNKASGSPGSLITVNGAGFAANETGISVTFDGNVVASNVSANTSGSWTTTFNVPSSTSGSHAISASGTITSASSVPSTSFSVGAAVALNKVSGSPGSPITVNGAGFTANETGISVTFDGSTVASNISANTSGSWTTTFNVPSSTSGSHSIGASGTITSAGSVSSATLNVGAAVTLNKTSGSPGSPITVNGAGFAANESGINVTFDGVVVASNVSANASGSWNATFNIPASTSGSHVVAVSGSITSGGSVPGVSFAVVATVTLSKSSGSPGNPITVNGVGFGANETGINITFDGNTVASDISANSSGSWTTTFNIPASISGSHTVAVSGNLTAAGSVPVTSFSVGAALTINKSSGSPGSPITVNGAGFAANETGISVTFDGNLVASNVSANSSGSWNTAFNVPSSTSGSHIIGASGTITSAGSVVIASFRVGAVVTLNKSSGAPGSPITVNGAGFAANETGISVTFDGNAVATNISANSSGSWTTSFNVAAAVFGPHTFSANGSLTPSVSVSQSAFNIVPSFTLTPTTGNIGSHVDITGAGFVANSRLRITYDDTEIALTGVATDAIGSISQTITIPVSKAGTHSIALTDSQGNNVKSSFVISNTPPSAPLEISPKDKTTISITGGITPTFKWTTVSSPNGVSYELQIANTPEFLETVLDKANIQTNQYTLEASEALARGQYYWRVKAIDRASNESTWSPTWTLKSGLMAPWMLGLIIALGAAAVGAGVYFGLIRLVIRKREAITVSEVESPVFTGGQWQALEPGESTKEREAPRRIALPEVSKSSKTLATEDQARLKVIVDFAQSIPLVEADYNVKWIVDLIESQIQTQISLSVYEQLLKGEFQLHYEPTWTRHPVYKELTTMLQKQPILQKLGMFIGDVERSGIDAISLIRQIYLESAAEIPQDFLGRSGWSYLAAVYSDAINWYAGKSLRDPAERDYVLESLGDSEQGTPKRWLSGEASMSFAGRLILAQDEQEAIQLRSLHLKLRRSWRNNEKARQVSGSITQLQLQRNELLSTFSQFGRTR